MFLPWDEIVAATPQLSQPRNVSSKNMIDPRVYLSIAKDDLNASRILLKNNCFPQSLFFTEQSVEKICKYIIIKDNIISEGELKKKIGHKSMMVFDILIKYMIEKLDSAETLKDVNINKLHKRLIEEQNYLSKLRIDSQNKKLDLDTLQEYEFKLLFYTKLDFNLNPDFSFYFNQAPEVFIDTLKKMNLLDSETLERIEISFNNPEEKKYYLELISEIQVKMVKYQNLMLAVLTFATIFSSHWESTRYPDGKENIAPYEIYNSETAIIKSLDTFQEYIDLTITGLEELSL